VADTCSKRRTLIAVALIAVVCLDQLTKVIIEGIIPRNTTRANREDTFFYFTHERNPGLIGGLFRDSPGIAKTAPVIATVVLVYLYRHLDPTSRLQSMGFGMIAGGAVGNLVDRFFRGSVVDFLQFDFYFLPDFLHLPTKKYPAFNIADSAICVGVGLLIYAWHKMSKRPSSDVAHAD